MRISFWRGRVRGGCMGLRRWGGVCIKKEEGRNLWPVESGGFDIGKIIEKEVFWIKIVKKFWK